MSTTVSTVVSIIAPPGMTLHELRCWHLTGDKQAPQKTKKSSQPFKYWLKADLMFPTNWWRRRDSNSRPPRCERDALPTELLPHSWKREIVYHNTPQLRKGDSEKFLIWAKRPSDRSVRPEPRHDSRYGADGTDGESAHQSAMPCAIARAMARRRMWSKTASSACGVVMKSTSTRQLGISGLRVTA